MESAVALTGLKDSAQPPGFEFAEVEVSEESRHRHKQENGVKSANLANFQLTGEGITDSFTRSDLSDVTNTDGSNHFETGRSLMRPTDGKAET